MNSVQGTNIYFIIFLFLLQKVFCIKKNLHFFIYQKITSGNHIERIVSESKIKNSEKRIQISS